VKEMSIAISIQEDDKALDDVEVQSEEYSKILIRNLCGLFVSIIDGRVYLLHQTAKEFLLGQDKVSQPTADAPWTWKHSLSVHDSNFVLANICMWYLRLKGFCLEEASQNMQDGNTDYETSNDDSIEDEGDGLGYKDNDIEDDREKIRKFIVDKLKSKYDFLDYAAIYWAVHFREAIIPKHHISIILALDICSPRVYPYTVWSLVYWHKKGFNKLPSGLTSLHLASRFGHQEVVRQLLAVPRVDVNSKIKISWTPLSLAARNGHENVVKLLLETDQIDVKSKSKNGQTPLSWAARKGHESVVKLLLEKNGVHINSRDKNRWTPLMHAILKKKKIVWLSYCLKQAGSASTIRIKWVIRRYAWLLILETRMLLRCCLR